MLARLHLNSFRVELPLAPDALEGGWEAAAAALVGGGGGPAGTAVYLEPSMFNHSCHPNLDARWVHGDATLTLVAARDVEPGEELRIAYIDVEQPVRARREQLHWGYGFVCACELCVQEAADDDVES